MKKEILAFSLAAAAATGCTSPNSAPATPGRTIEEHVTVLETPTPKPTTKVFDHYTDKKYTNAEVLLKASNAQKGLKAINATMLNKFVNIVGTYGHQNDHPEVGYYSKRLVVKDSRNGNVYTDELDFAKPVGNVKEGKLTGITIFVSKPGESQAHHVFTDGSAREAVVDSMMVDFPINGLADTPIGYTPFGPKQFQADFEKYGQQAEFIEDIQAITKAGPVIQSDYERAVTQTIASH